ncbi:MAG: hypothetical protein PVH88_18630 [Ignavibacteria bacterium]|jgi:hypothetical protein
MQPTDYINVTTIAVTLRFEKTDLDMPICFALDDVEIKGKKTVSFKYEVPKTRKLSEWEPEIVLRRNENDDQLEIAGTFLPSQPERVNISVYRFDKPREEIFIPIVKINHS